MWVSGLATELMKNNRAVRFSRGKARRVNRISYPKGNKEDASAAEIVRALKGEIKVFEIRHADLRNSSLSNKALKLGADFSGTYPTRRIRLKLAIVAITVLSSR
jgi:hypothetical protein